MSAIYRCCQLVLHLAIPVLKDSSSPNERSRFNLAAECLVYTLSMEGTLISTLNNGAKFGSWEMDIEDFTQHWLPSINTFLFSQTIASNTRIGGHKWSHGPLVGKPCSKRFVKAWIILISKEAAVVNSKGGVLYSGYNKGGGGYAAGAGLGGANGPPQYVSSSSSSSASSSASSSVNGGGGAIIQIPHHHQKHKHVNRKGPEYFNDVFNVSTGACTLSGQLACWATDHSTGVLGLAHFQDRATDHSTTGPQTIQREYWDLHTFRTVGVLGHRPFNVSTGTCTLSGQDHRPSLYLQDSARVPKTNLRKEVKILVKKDESTKIPISALSAVSKLMSNEQKLVLSRFLSNRTLCDSTGSSLCDTSGSLREFKRPLGSRVTVGDARKGASNLHGAAVKTVVKYRDNTGVKSRIRGEVYTAGGGAAAGGGAVGGGGLVGGSGASSSSSSWSSSSSAGAGIGGFPSQETVVQNGPGFFDNVFNIPISVLKAVNQLLNNKHRRRRR
uniref:Uncharacterized protein n=1 Tax=Timema tahoe TaxID=61484 RepID=A0A7R9IEA2_9NEOP|nr:unnamed protein product [Timema tahoe]